MKSQTVTSYFGIDKKVFATTGAYDAVVNVDTKVFIHPLLLRGTTAPELKESYAKVQKHFAEILKLILASKKVGDRAWCAAHERLTFPEVADIGTGYSRASRHGSGIGRKLARQLLVSAKQMVDAGVVEPEIFELMGLFQPNIGRDRLSDTIAGIIKADLFAYSERAFRNLGVSGKRISKVQYGHKTYLVPVRPVSGDPILLVPREILADLPVAACFSEVDIVCAANAALRQIVNGIIGETWKEAVSVRKAKLRDVLLRHPKVFFDLIEVYRRKTGKEYDFDADPAGLVSWLRAAESWTAMHALPLSMPKAPGQKDVESVVLDMTQKFKELIEDRGLHKLLYREDGRPRRETAAQFLYFGVADCYCEANDIGLTRGPETGRGRVDFKAEKGYMKKVVVEVKLTRNPNLVHGYTDQLRIYQAAEKAKVSVYLVIDVDHGSAERLKALRMTVKKARGEGRPAPTVVYVDARTKTTASAA